MVSAELPADHEMRRWLSPALIPTPCGVVGLASAYFTFTDACVSVPPEIHCRQSRLVAGLAELAPTMAGSSQPEVPPSASAS